MNAHEMGADEILELVDELQRRLHSKGITTEIYIVGGAALALAGTPHRMTRDVDAVYREQAAVESIATELAEEVGIPPGWLNQAALPYVPARDPELETEVLPGVRLAPDTHLLAMKLAAFRTRDLDDIVVLLRRLGISSEDQLGQLVEHVYGDEQAHLSFGGDWRSEVVAIWRQLGPRAEEPDDRRA